MLAISLNQKGGDPINYSALASELLETVRTLLRTTTQRRVNEFSKGEMFIMNYLVDSGGTAAPCQLSDAMHASSARIAAALNSLQRKGLIVRHVDTSDHRRRLVTITEDGRQVVMSKRRQIQADMEQVLRQLGEHDAMEYLRILKRIVEISKLHERGT